MIDAGHIPPPFPDWTASISLAGIPALIAVVAGILPTALTVIATVMGIIWYSMMIADWITQRKVKRAAAEATNLIALATKIAAQLVNTAEVAAKGITAQAGPVAAQVVARAVPVAAQVVATAATVAADLRDP